MSDIEFYTCENTRDYKFELTGVLKEDGSWMGDRGLENEVKRMAEMNELTLTDKQDRERIRTLFDGTYIFTIEK